MQRVLDPPMPPDIASILPGLPRLAANVITDIGGYSLPATCRSLSTVFEMLRPAP
jgi:hypothetical protein